MESSTRVHPAPSFIKMDSIPEQRGGLEDNSYFGIDDDTKNDTNFDTLNDDSKNMPPPIKRNAIHHQQRAGRTKSSRRKIQESDELSFAEKLSVQKYPSTKNVAPQQWEREDDGSTIVSEATGGTSVFMSRVSQKVDVLRTKVLIESSRNVKSDPSCSLVPGAENLQAAYYLDRRCQGIFPGGDCPWLSMVCLESLTRILTGREKEGKPSCLEGEEVSGKRGNDVDEDLDIGDDENNNIFLVTNRLLGKSGVIPFLGSAMSQSMIVATKLVFAEGYPKIDDFSNPCRNLNDRADECWNYCRDRLNLISSLIDEACFFSEQNRRSFCEDDPFSFEDRKEGLVFHILLFLQKCAQCDLSQLDQKRSETMSFALRTLTSLTHENTLAAEQMKISYRRDTNMIKAKAPTTIILGIDILAKLLFKLEESHSLCSTKSIGTALPSSKRETDHDMYRYDCTIFCLTTFANIIEGAGIRRMLIEIKVMLQSGSSLSWVKWLCQWLVKQTDSFREEILSIGTDRSNKDPNGGQNITKPGNGSSNNINNEHEELQKHEEEKLVAAGNGCVVLACLMTESDDDDPEFSVTLRKLIKDQMPLNKDGSSSGLTLIVNTLKAYCNYYQISMGQVSFAVVAPVKKLIEELEDIVKFEESDG